MTEAELVIHEPAPPILLDPVQLQTAREYGRDLVVFRKSCLELATSDEATAGSCFYRLKKGGQTIEGPSIRFAEILAYTYRNLHCGARIVEETGTSLTAQGVCFDLERNLRNDSSVRRGIVGRNGQRYKSDVITSTANAACSIARRNAILMTVPAVFYGAIIEKCKEVSLGRDLSRAARIDKALEMYKSMGAATGDVLQIVGRDSAADITTDDLITLRGLVTAIRDGSTTMEQVISSKGDTDKRILPSNILDGNSA